MFAWPPYSDMVEVGVLNGFFRKGDELIWFYAQSGSYKPLSCRDPYNKGRACRFCDCFCRLPLVLGNKRQGVYSLLDVKPDPVCRKVAVYGKLRQPVAQELFGL